MLILISLLLVLPFAIYGKDFIKKHSKALYIVSTLIAISTVYIVVSKTMLKFPMFVRQNIFNLFANGAIASAMFIVVMFIGALSRESKLRKKLMPIRAELSIMASILTLGHNVAFGISYFKFLFITPEKLPGTQLVASIISLIMISIMIPLFITSFYSIRKKMSGKNWKNLQKLAYIFYALMYIHVLLLAIPYALKGRSGYTLMVVVYSVIFAVYFAMRVSKTMAKSSKTVKSGLWVLASAVCVFAILLSIPNVIVKQEDKLAHKREVAMQEQTAQVNGNNEGKEPSTTPNDSAQDDSGNANGSAQDDSGDTNDKAQDDKKDDKEEPQKENKDDADKKDDKKDESVKEDKKTVEEESKTGEDKKEERDDKKPEEEEEPKEEKETVKEEKPEPVEEKKETVKEEQEPLTDAQDDNKEPEKDPSTDAQDDSKEPVISTEGEAEVEKSQTKDDSVEPAPEPEPQKIYNDGTYVGYGQGYVAPVTVTVTIQNDAIVSVFASGQEDEPYWTDCLNTMPTRIIAAQSAEVMAVSGATVSAEAIKTGARNAINSARR